MSDTNSTAPVYRKKITAEIFAPYPEVQPHETKWLGIIYGDLRGIEPGMSAYGEFVKLSGEFIAENTETGLRVTATSAILPRIGESVLLHFLSNLGIEKGKIGERLDTGRVAFGMEIGIEGRARKGENDQTSPYTWVIRPTAALAKSPVALLRDQFWSAATPAIAAPDASAETPHNPDTGEVPAGPKKSKKG